MKKFYASIIAVLASACSSGDPGLFGPSSSGAGGMSSASSSAGPTSGMGGAVSSSASASAPTSSSVSSDASSSSSGGGFYWKSGVQQNVAEADMIGWTECYSGQYADTGVLRQQILGKCPGTKLALACRQKGSSTLTLVAVGDSQDVTFSFGTNDNMSVHDANGVGWYMAGNGWGFLPGGETRDGSCDATGISPAVPGPDGDKRMCWASGSDALIVGFRCGYDCNTNHPGFDYSYDRVVMSAP